MEGRYKSECGEGEWGKGEGVSSKGGKCPSFSGWLTKPTPPDKQNAKTCS
jgi:hypothetical protein